MQKPPERIPRNATIAVQIKDIPAGKGECNKLELIVIVTNSGAFKLNQIVVGTFLK